MKLRAFSIVLIIAVIATAFVLPTPAKAVAYGASFTTSVTYMNIGTGPATVTMMFYPEGSASPVTWNEPSLPVNAAASLYAGTVFSGSFSGSAVVSSDSPLAVTGVQTSTTVKNRMLSNGFSAGAPVFTIPTVLKATFTTNTIFSVQNADSEANNVTVTFNPVSGTPFSETINNLPAGAAKIYDMGTATVPGLLATFNGSVKITAKKSASPAVDGAVVASSQELSTSNDNSYAFEGATNGGPVVYMPSAFCNWVPGLVQSAYAVMNMGANPVNLSVVYRVAGSATTYTDNSVTNLGPGLKASLNACSVAPNGFIGSATITATGTSPSIVAIGKIYNGGLSTAYSGFSQGYQTVALPYVRFTNAYWTAGSKQRVFIAIQNVGAGSLAAGSVSAKFYDADGLLVGTLTNPSAIAVGDKWSVAANQLGTAGSEFGYWLTKTGGGAIISGPTGAQLAVIARAQTYLTSTTSTGEDYNAIPVQ